MKNPLFDLLFNGLMGAIGGLIFYASMKFAKKHSKNKNEEEKEPKRKQPKFIRIFGFSVSLIGFLTALTGAIIGIAGDENIVVTFYIFGLAFLLLGAFANNYKTR